MKHSLCEECFGYMNCCWHKYFMPRKDWKAYKTFIKGDILPIESYHVEECPGFRASNRSKVTVRELSEITGKSISSILRMSEQELNALLPDGYIVYKIKDDKKYHDYFLFFKEEDIDSNSLEKYAIEYR